MILLEFFFSYPFWARVVALVAALLCAGIIGSILVLVPRDVEPAKTILDPKHAQPATSIINKIGNIDGNQGIVSQGQTGNNKSEQP